MKEAFITILAFIGIVVLGIIGGACECAAVANRRGPMIVGEHKLPKAPEPRCFFCDGLLPVRMVARNEEPIVTGIAIPLLTDCGPAQKALPVCRLCLEKLKAVVLSVDEVEAPAKPDQPEEVACGAGLPEQSEGKSDG